MIPVRTRLPASPQAARPWRRFLDLSSDDIASPIKQCMDRAAIVRASEIAQKAASAEADGWPRSVYVIGPADDVGFNKIGITRDPFYRLDALQTGNWHKLEIKALLWTMVATTLEAAALNLATEIGARSIGEWVELDAIGATGLALMAARIHRIRVMSSDAYLDGLASALSC